MAPIQYRTVVTTSVVMLIYCLYVTSESCLMRNGQLFNLVNHQQSTVSVNKVSINQQSNSAAQSNLTFLCYFYGVFLWYFYGTSILLILGYFDQYQYIIQTFIFPNSSSNLLTTENQKLLVAIYFW